MLAGLIAGGRGSTLITSAPMSAISLVQKGAEMKVPHSTTFTSDNAWSVILILPPID